MQLRPDTVNVLKNFASINTNLVIKKGRIIQTIAPSKDIIATFESDDDFNANVAVFNLNELLGVLGAFDNPDLVLEEKSMTIKHGKQKVNYVYADESLLITPPAKGIKFPEADGKITTVSFKLSDAALSKLDKMSTILSSEDLAVIGNGKTIILKVFDKKNPTCNEFEIDTEVATSEKFHVNFKINKLKLLSGNYSVDISSQRISRFSHDTMKLVYFIAVEQDSTFS